MLFLKYNIWADKRGVAQLVERLVRDQEAVCSSHITPTSKNARKPCIHAVSGSFLFLWDWMGFDHDPCRDPYGD